MFKLLDYLIGSFIILLFVGAFGTLGFTIYREMISTKTCTTVQIESIGGCDKGGYCGVKYTNGLTGIQQYPTLGSNAKHCAKAYK